MHVSSNPSISYIFVFELMTPPPITVYHSNMSDILHQSNPPHNISIYETDCFLYFLNIISPITQVCDSLK